MNDRKPMDFLPAGYVQAAEAATDVGQDYESGAPEGFAIAFIAVVAAVIAALLLAHFVAG